jgi:hypothetical protein
MTNRWTLKLSITKVLPVASPANLLIRSKYTNRLKNTSFVVGQYLRIRRRYDSRDMVGMLRAWKVKAEVGDVREVWEAVVRD